ncbi:MAG: rhodanese-like domain-containing protein [Acidimicrobiia bacterium]
MSVASPFGEVRTIDREELVGKLQRGDRFRLVMALNEWAFRAKHIPGSEHFNTPEELFSSLNPDEEVVVYCTSVDCLASVALYHDLVARGYRNVRRYAGGLTDWEAAGLQLEGDWATNGRPSEGG